MSAATSIEAAVQDEVKHVQEQYRGAMQVRRLVYIAEHAPPALSVSVFKLALTSTPQPGAALLSETVNAAQAVHPSLGSPPLPPTNLLPTLEHAHSALLRSLDASLTSAKRDGERSLIFGALLQYAEALYRYGDFGGALVRYMESREWASTREDVLRVCLGVIKCSVLTGSFSHVRSQVQRIRASQQPDNAAAAGGGGSASAPPTAKEDSETAALNAKLDACLGLAALKSASYRSAASCFLAVTSALLLPEVISLRDCLIYGSICALATFTRSELRASLLQQPEWKKNVDATCPAWRQLVSAYIDSDYQLTFRLLADLSLALSLHPALSPHLHRLVKDIRAKAACQFFLPYTALQLQVMADGMGLSMQELEALIAELIGEGKLNGRLDMQHGLVVKKPAEGRVRTYTKARRLAERLVRDGQALMMRMSLIECDIAVHAVKKAEKDAAKKGSS